MQDDDRVRDSALLQAERLLVGAGRRYLPVPDALGRDSSQVEAVLATHFSRPPVRIRSELSWRDDPPEIRITRVGRFNTANDRARVVVRVAASGRPRVWLEQRAHPILFSTPFVPIFPLVALVVAAGAGDLAMVTFWVVFWLATRSIVEVARRADSRLLQTLLSKLATGECTKP